MLLNSVSHHAMIFPAVYPRAYRSRSVGKTTTTGTMINDLCLYKPATIYLEDFVVKDLSYDTRNRKDRRKTYSGRYKEPMNHPLLHRFLPRQSPHIFQ